MKLLLISGHGAGDPGRTVRVIHGAGNRHTLEVRQ